jgi:phenylpyruvate tautomerase PptA (4-oxalocrotonate tautomerase family)
MPEVVVNAVEERTQERKKTLMQKITVALQDAFNAQPDRIVQIVEAKADNKARGGALQRSPVKNIPGPFSPGCHRHPVPNDQGHPAPGGAVRARVGMQKAAHTLKQPPVHCVLRCVWNTPEMPRDQVNHYMETTR